MRLVDIYFRSLLNSRKSILDNREGKIDVTSIMNANNDVDKLETISYKCNIDEDWLINIEKGIEFIEKAIKEERQFITTQGEVVRIEKAKKTTKDTVKHLSKHSDLITHLPDNQDDTIVPDKLYIVEKLSDFTVYENRFIYMLLCYLRDFINLRLEKIEDKLTTYTASVYFKKDIDIHSRNIKIETKLDDVIKQDTFLIEKYKNMPVISRINDVYDTVLSLLNTPLMIEVGKAPMIKPPIVATNVLKMNPNFKGALALYNFIASYPKDGYSFEEIKEVFNPFDKDMAEDYGIVISLCAFTTYKYGNKLKTLLADQYQKDNKEQEAKELKKYDEQIEKIKRRIKETNKGWEEYTITLEQKQRTLEAKMFEISKLQEKVDTLVEKINLLEQEKEKLNIEVIEADKVINEKVEKIMQLNEKYINDLRALNEVKEEEKQELSEKLTYEKEEVVLKFNKNIDELNDELIRANDEKQIILNNQRVQLENVQDQIRILEVKKEELMNSNQQKIQEIISNYDNQIKELTNNYDNRIDEITSKFDNKIQESYNEKDKLVSEYEQKIVDIKDENQKTIIKLENDFQKIREDLQEKLIDDEEQYNYLLVKKNLILANLNAMRHREGMNSFEEELNLQDKCKVLDDQMKSFKKYYDYQYRIIKKQLKDDMYNQFLNEEENKALEKEEQKANKSKAKEIKEEKISEIAPNAENSVETKENKEEK